MPIAFENGHSVETVDFNYPDDEGDRGNPLECELTEAPTSRSKSADATLASLFGFVLTYGGVNERQFFVTANVVSFAMGTHPNQRAGGDPIAAGLGMNKAAWFRRVNQIRKILRSRGSILPKIAGEWSKSARKSIQTKTKQTHEQRKSSSNIRASNLPSLLERAHQGTRNSN